MSRKMFWRHTGCHTYNYCDLTTATDHNHSTQRLQLTRDAPRVLALERHRASALGGYRKRGCRLRDTT